MNRNEACALVDDELGRALKKFPRHTTSAHHHYAVLLEEVDELWDAVKTNNIPHAKKEAVQVAAMAIRFLMEVE